MTLPNTTVDDVKAFIELSPHPCGMKDKNSVYVHANAHYARLVGFKHSQEFIGRTDFDLPAGAPRCAPIFQAQDQEVMRTPHVMKILDIHPESDGNWYAMFTTKTTFLDTDGKIGGVFFQMQDITSPRILQFGTILGNTTPWIEESNVLNQFSYMFGTPKNLSLTQRQEQLLFFLMRRYSIKKIALSLGVSLRTIYCELDKLKKKFNASNTSDLIDKSITHECINVLPSGLSYCQISAILQEN